MNMNRTREVVTTGRRTAVLRELLADDYPADVAMAAVDGIVEQVESALCELRRLGIDDSAISAIEVVAVSLEQTRKAS